jgi:hypothetical protein
MANRNYRLLTRDLVNEYQNTRKRAFFSFDEIVKLIKGEINEPRNWFVERDGSLFLNAYDFSNLAKSYEEKDVVKFFEAF